MALFWLMRGALLATGASGLATVILLRRRLQADAARLRLEFLYPGPPDRFDFQVTRAVITCCYLVAFPIYGLLLFLLGGSLVDVIVFALPAVAGLALAFPRRRQWERFALAQN